MAHACDAISSQARQITQKREYLMMILFYLGFTCSLIFTLRETAFLHDCIVTRMKLNVNLQSWFIFIHREKNSHLTRDDNALFVEIHRLVFDVGRRR